MIRDSAHLVLNPIVQMQRHIFRDQDWFPGLFRDDWLLCLSRVTNFLSIKRYPQCRIPKTMTNKIRSISTMFLGGRTDFLTHHSSLNLVQHLSLVYNEHIACSPLPWILSFWIILEKTAHWNHQILRFFWVEFTSHSIYVCHVYSITSTGGKP